MKSLFDLLASAKRFVSSGFGQGVLAVAGVVIAIVFGIIQYYSGNDFISGVTAALPVKCVNIHIRKKEKNEVNISEINKAISDLNFKNCGITYENDDLDTHLSVDYFTDNISIKAEAQRLAGKMREILPDKFKSISSNRETTEDPKFMEVDKLGLYLMP